MAADRLGHDIPRALQVITLALPHAGDAYGAGTLPTAGPDINIVLVGASPQIGRSINTVLVAHADGSVAAEFAATSAGLTAALAACVSGDIVLLPPQTITGTSWSVPAGVTLYGIDRRASVLVGQLTGGDGAVIAHLTVSRAANDGGTLITVQGPASDSDTLRLYDCVVDCEQAGSGSAIAVDVNGLGPVIAWGCEISGSSASGDGYGVRGQTGQATLRHSAVYGSTEPYLQ